LAAKNMPGMGVWVAGRSEVGKREFYKQRRRRISSYEVWGCSVRSCKAGKGSALSGQGNAKGEKRGKPHGMGPKYRGVEKLKVQATEKTQKGQGSNISGTHQGGDRF